MAGHSILTQLAMSCLDEHVRAVWRDQEAAIIEDFCTWPDQYFNPDRYDEIAPYMLIIDDLPFHYPPSSHVRYHWRMVKTSHGPQIEPVPEEPNRHWQFMRDGLQHYLAAIANDLSVGRNDDAARRLGILLHVMQDAHELHALEGPWGTDFFVLDRLLEWPSGDAHLSPTELILNHPFHEGEIAGYRPRLEGTSIDEVVFRLYALYVNTILSVRPLHVPVAQALMTEDHTRAEGLLRQINEGIARLSADVIHTVTALATGRFEPSQIAALCRVYLDPMAAVQRPWTAKGTYKFTPIVPGACLDPEHRRRPLCLRQPDGSTRRFDHGWGSGAHVHLAMAYEIPPAVYRRLTMQIGLHDPLGMKGCVDLSVIVRGRTIVEQRLESTAPTCALDIAMDEGGEVRIILREVSGSDPDDNHLVWGDPTLVKQ